MVSIGNWKYANDAKAIEVNVDNPDDTRENIVYLKDVKVGDAAQTTFSLGADYEIIQGLGIDANYYFANNLYADFDIGDETFEQPGRTAWRLPSYGLMDLGAFYNFNVSKVGFTLRVNVNNVLDNEYLSESDTNYLYDPEDTDDRLIPDSENGSVDNRVFYGFGRTWNVGLKVRF